MMLRFSTRCSRLPHRRESAPNLRDGVEGWPSNSTVTIGGVISHLTAPLRRQVALCREWIAHVIKVRAQRVLNSNAFLSHRVADHAVVTTIRVRKVGVWRIWQSPDDAPGDDHRAVLDDRAFAENTFPRMNAPSQRLCRAGRRWRNVADFFQRIPGVFAAFKQGGVPSG